MKKNIYKFAAVLAAAAVSLSTISFTAFAEDAWIKGFTGSESSKDFSFTNETASGVTIENTKVNNGKFSDGEDSFIYYAKETAIDKDFEFSAIVNIDSYGTGEEASNPQQGSVGIAVIDELYNKTDDKKFTNGLFLGTYAKDKNADLSIHPMIRSNSDKKEVGDSLSDTIPNSGENLGSFTLSIKKSGNVYTLSCGDKSAEYEVSSLSDSIYPCLYAARNVKATFSNVSLKVDNRVLKELKLAESPKDTYFYGESFDKAGVKVTAEYDDGTSEEISDYSVKGYSKNRIGKQIIYIAKGDIKVPLEITVKNIGISEFTLENVPVRTTFYKGMPFSVDGVQAVVKYDNGKSKTLSGDDLVFSLNSKTIKNGDILKDAGTKQINVSVKKTEGISTSALSSSFYVNVLSDSAKSIEIKELPVKKVYYLGEKADYTGIRPVINFSDGKSEVTDLSQFDVTGFDTGSVGEKTITLTYKYDPTVKADFKIDVKEKQPTSLVITSYPKTTVKVGESFVSDGIKAGIKYDNGDIEEISDFTVDTSNYDSSSEGITSVLVKADGTGLYPIELKISVKNFAEGKWRKAIFGQSASLEKEESGSAGVKADEYGTVNGKINVAAWDATGKITADHDGIVYYYTKVNAENNFEITADITVNRYLEHNNDDTKRNGQEAFGIMARDAVPFEDADGNLTTDYSAAKKDEEGVAVTREVNAVFASNTVCIGGYSGTGWPNDPTAASYEKNTKLNRINLFGRTGVEAPDGGGTKMGPFAVSSDFPKEGNKYRVTLKKVNGGFSASCFNYATNETMYANTYDENCLTVQDKENMYVGFFASRWADIDVENVYFSETDKATSPVIVNNEKKAQTPSLDFYSQPYAKKTEYNLVLRALNVSGTAVVRVNGEVQAQDVAVSGDTTIPVTVKEDKENDVVVVFTPDDKLSLTDYSDIVLREKVIHKNFDKTVQTVYAAPDGSPMGNGSYDSPYDADTAVGFLEAGQTVVLKEGVYKRTKPLEIALGNDGTASAYKTLCAEDGKNVIFDLQNKYAGAVVTGNYWKIKGIEFINSGDNLKCFHLGGSNCIVESCKFHDNADMGLQISRTYSTDDRSKWPSNNLVIYCEAYNNCDPSKINADGFGAKLTVGEGNVFKNCLSHHNVDDGWDLYTKVNTGAIGAVTLENCVSYRNGYKLLEDGTEEAYGAGGHNGFKCGGENVAVDHKLVNCIAFGNDSNGVTTNSNPHLKLENVVSFDNNNANIRLYSDKPDEYDYSLTNVYTNNCRKDECDYIGGVNKDPDYVNHSTIPAVSESNYVQLQIGGKSVNSKGEEMTAERVREIAKYIIEENGINFDWKF